jgi:MFS transporter, PPP family, 3-phenylpropionic acid transporter
MRPPVRFIALFAAIYGGFGVLSPYQPALLSTRGLSAETIGYVIALGGIIRLVGTPPLGRLADARRAVRIALCAACAASALAAAAYAVEPAGALLVALALAQSAALAPTAPFADAIGVSAARREKFSYGAIRGIGSASFVLATIFAGALASAFGWTATALAQAALLAVAAPVALFAPEPTAHSHERAQVAWRDLLKIRAFRRIILIAGLILGSHALHDGFAIVYWTREGVSPRLAGLLWSGSVAAEVLVFMAIGPALLARLGERGAMMLSLGAAMLRWIVMACTANPLVMAFSEPLHGLTFALLHLACMQVIARVVPNQLAASAQAFYSAIGVGLANVVMSAISGVLFARLGGGGFWIMAALCACALPLLMRDPDLFETSKS